jgi:hypothetical protein
MDGKACDRWPCFQAVAGTDVGHPPYRDGILERQFEERLESFAPCYSQSLPLAEILRKPYPTLAFKKHTKKKKRNKKTRVYS